MQAFAVQSYVTGEGPYANWAKHVSDPFGYNLLTVSLHFPPQTQFVQADMAPDFIIVACKPRYWLVQWLLLQVIGNEDRIPTL